MSETDELQARITELEAERDRLADKMERAMIAVAHFTHSYNQDLETIAGLRKEIAGLHQEVGMLSGNPEAVHQGALAALSAIKQMTELKAERYALKEELKMEVRNAKWEADRAQTAVEITTQAIADNEQLIAENAALRKALEDAPHERYCLSEWERNMFRRKEPQPNACDCWKASIPLPTQQSPELSLPDSERAGNNK